MTKHKTAWLSLAPGLIASLVCAASHPLFALNVAFFALSQLIVIGVVALWRPRPAVVAGTAIGAAIYFSVFAAWAFTRTPPDTAPCDA